jgi:hypothetical protein
MSAPIKPPGGGPGRPVPPGADPSGPTSGGAGRPDAAGGSFREALEGARGAEAAGTSPALGADDPIVQDLRAGRIGPTEAVDRMVRRALEAPAASRLSPVLRSELEGHLRRTLQDDPTLAALVRDLSRGG